MTQDQILQAAIALTPDLRADLVQAISQTIDNKYLGFSNSFVNELKRRDFELENGITEEIPYEDVLSEVRRALK